MDVQGKVVIITGASMALARRQPASSPMRARRWCLRRGLLTHWKRSLGACQSRPKRCGFMDLPLLPQQASAARAVPTMELAVMQRGLAALAAVSRAGHACVV